jgi:hypothetical protein
VSSVELAGRGSTRITVEATRKLRANFDQIERKRVSGLSEAR